MEQRFATCCEWLFYVGEFQNFDAFGKTLDPLTFKDNKG